VSQLVEALATAPAAQPAAPAAPSALDRLGAAASKARARSIESQYESLQRLLSGVRGHLDDDE